MKAAEGHTADGLAGQLLEARAFLWKAVARLSPDRWSESPSPSYSPVGWHLGHIAVTQARWLLPRDPVGDRFGAFFDPVQTAKAVRGELPSPDELRAFLAQVLERARERLRAEPLPTVPGLPPEFLVRHVAQHELQHAEHVQVIAALLERRLQRGAVVAEYAYVAIHPQAHLRGGGWQRCPYVRVPQLKEQIRRPYDAGTSSARNWIDLSNVRQAFNAIGGPPYGCVTWLKLNARRN